MRLVGGDAAYLAWRATVLELPPVIPLWWAQAVSDGYCLHKDRVCSRIGSCCLPPMAANAYCGGLSRGWCYLAFAPNFD